VVAFGTTVVVVGSTRVVVVAGLLGVAIEGADVGAAVEGAAVVDVEEVADAAAAAEFLATATDSFFAGLEQAAAPRPKTTSAETVPNLILRIR
jgi:hypothetical protein